MPVLDRAALEQSVLADLHAIASQLGVDGYRRLRKPELIDAILASQSDEPSQTSAAADAPREADEAADESAAADDDATEGDAAPRRSRSRRGRGRRSGATRGARDADERDDAQSDEPATTGGGDGNGSRDAEAERVAEGVVELLSNGSGFLRVDGPDPSDADVYISAAQVRRCELVSGDRVAGPVRRPRRSERYPSLIRIDTINGVAADQVAEGTHYEDLPAAFSTERFALGADDPTLKAIEWLTPLGRGSRAVIVGDARAGKTEALRRLAAALAAQPELDVSVVLVGARPEEVGEWSPGPPVPTVALTLTASAEVQAQAVERAIETAKRIASRGGHAVVLIDTLDGLHPPAARRALAAARRIVDGGSLTIVATATKPFGGETTVIALDVALTSTGRLPALDLVRSGTLRAELLVGDAGAEAIAQARAAALE